VIQLSAVVGRSFWQGLVAHLVERRDIHEALIALRRRRLIMEKQDSVFPGEREYVFRHVLIREVAYDTLPRAKRGRAHSEVGAWIEMMRGPRAMEVSDVLAHHYVQAYKCLQQDDVRLKARDYSLAAARRALQNFAITQAKNHGRLAVDLSRETPELVEALEALGDLYALTFTSEGAWKAYTEALNELQGNGGTSSPGFARLCGKATIVPTRWRATMRDAPPPDEVGRLIEAGLAAVGKTESPDRALLLASEAFFHGLGFGTGEVAEEKTQEAVALAESIDDPNLISTALDAACHPAMLHGRWSDVHQINKRRVALISRLSDVREICDAYGMAALSAIRIGNYREGLTYAQEEVKRARGVDAGSYLQGLVWSVAALFVLGEWDAALEAQAEIERLHEESQQNVPGPMAMRAYSSALLCHRLRGNRRAIDYYIGVFDRFSEQWPDELGGLADAARTFMYEGDFVRARDLLPAIENEYLSVHLEALCDLMLVSESWDEAAPTLSLARREERRSGVVALGFYADRLEGRLLGANGDIEGAVPLLRRSADGFASISAQWDEACSRLLLAEALSLSDGGAEAAQQLTAAAHTFRLLSSVREERLASDLRKKSSS